jgi:hypothetical protein
MMAIDLLKLSRRPTAESPYFRASYQTLYLAGENASTDLTRLQKVNRNGVRTEEEGSEIRAVCEASSRWQYSESGFQGAPLK